MGVFAGPALSHNLNGRYRLKDVDIQSTLDNLEYTIASGTVDISNLKSSDIGIVVGSGISLPLGNQMNLSVDVRYQLGLTNQFDDVPLSAIPVWSAQETPAEFPVCDLSTGKGLDMRNRFSTLSVGLSLPL